MAILPYALRIPPRLPPRIQQAKAGGSLELKACCCLSECLSECVLPVSLHILHAISTQSGPFQFGQHQTFSKALPKGTADNHYVQYDHIHIPLTWQNDNTVSWGFLALFN